MDSGCISILVTRRVMPMVISIGSMIVQLRLLNSQSTTRKWYQLLNSDQDSLILNILHSMEKSRILEWF